ncbi:MAG TPA: AMP-dependent synthetase/ligase [Solirubrobacteraceae bacterium]|nr:AMP-dependent synthetase/ligase [Solirubrobacteraceae bacterium]
MATTESTDALAGSGTADARTLCEAFQASAARGGDAVALRTPGDAEVISWSAYAGRVEALARGLAAHGIGAGDTVALMLTNRPEAYLLDTAALHLGATPFSIYNTSAPAQIEYVLTHAGCRLVVTEKQFLDRVLSVREHLPALQYVFVIDGATAGTADLEELIAAGDPAFDFEAAWRAVMPSDIATLIYTSGTTGPPKGVEVTHDNLVWTGKTWADVTAQPVGGRLMSYLPMAHLADRVCSHYLAMLTGASITCVVDAKAIVPAVGEAHPTLWLGVPRIWEKLKASLEARLLGEPDDAKRGAIAQALADGVQRTRLEQAGEPVPAELGQRCAESDARIFAPLREQLGIDAGSFMLSGAAPIAMDVLEFFAALGMPVNEGYGMTESAAVATMNCSGGRRLGTVGRPLPGVEAALAEDSELLVRGRLVMKGYRSMPEKTAEAIDSDGWLHTGDIAEIDEHGFVKIVDRKKEIIINAAGKNMSPANIELAMKAGTPLIGSAVTIGDGRPFNTALVVLDSDAAAAFAKANAIAYGGVADLAAHELVRAEIAAGIERANERLSRVEQIKKYTLLGVEWVPGGDEVTPTMKLKRKPIADKYEAEIEAMYAR